MAEPVEGWGDLSGDGCGGEVGSGRVWRGPHRVKNIATPAILNAVDRGQHEVGAPTSESQCRAPIDHSREGLAGGFQWPRDPNVSCVWHEPYKSRGSALSWAASLTRFWDRNSAPASGSHPVTRWPFWNWG